MNVHLRLHQSRTHASATAASTLATAPVLAPPAQPAGTATSPLSCPFPVLKTNILSKAATSVRPARQAQSAKLMAHKRSAFPEKNAREPRTSTQSLFHAQQARSALMERLYLTVMREAGLLKGQRFALCAQKATCVQTNLTQKSLVLMAHTKTKLVKQFAVLAPLVRSVQPQIKTSHPSHAQREATLWPLAQLFVLNVQQVSAATRPLELSQLVLLVSTQLLA